MFIEINGRILDLAEYDKEVRTVKNLLCMDAQELFDKFGFEQKGKTFYNKNLDLEINFSIKKKEKRKIV